MLPRDAMLRGQVPTTDYPKIQATTDVIRTSPEVKEAVVPLATNASSPPMAKPLLLTSEVERLPAFGEN